MNRKLLFIPLFIAIILAGIFGPFFGASHEARTKDISPDIVTPSEQTLLAQKENRVKKPPRKKPSTTKTASHDCSGQLELVESGTASWYGGDFHGKPMKNGQLFNKWAYTVAYHSLPLNTPICIEQNGVIIPALVTDTGSFRQKYGRTIDVSEGIAVKLGFKERGLAFVNIYKVIANT